MPSVLDKDLVEVLTAGQKCTVIVEMERQVQEVFDRLEKQNFANMEERGDTMNKWLKEMAEECQGPLKKYLESQGAKFETMWINNTLQVHEATLPIVQGLEKFPGIKAIRGDAIVAEILRSVVRPKQ